MLLEPTPVEPIQSSYLETPIPAVQAKDTLLAVSVVAGDGEVSTAGIGVETWKMVDCAVTLIDELSAMVAVSVSVADAVEMSRLLKVAEPDERVAEVVPLSSDAASAMETELVAAAAVVPFSVSWTTGAGDIAVPVATVVGGSVEKATA